MERRGEGERGARGGIEKMDFSLVADYPDVM